MSAGNVPADQVRRSLRASLKDGIAWSVMNGAGERYIQPFAVLEGFGLMGIAAISALPGLVGSLIQIWSANLTDASGRRKRMFVLGSLVQALAWSGACVAVALPADPAMMLMIATYVVIFGLQNFTVPPWVSVMGDLVPVERRGRYFGLRNLLVGAGICASFLAGGWWVDVCAAEESLGFAGIRGRSFGFFSLFALAGVARLVSTWYLAQMAEPEYRRIPADRFTLGQFLRRVPGGNFGRFVLYTAMLHFGIGFAGAYFPWYVLEFLKFRAGEFAWLWTVHLIAFFGAQPLFGRIGDRIGNKPLIAAGGLGITLIPALWLISADFRYLVAVQIYDGIVWGAFAIASGNYLYDCVSAPKRARCSAYSAFVSSFAGLLGTFGGALVGEAAGTPVRIAGIAFEHPFECMLFVSSALRFLATILLVWTFREIRVRGPEEEPPTMWRLIFKRFWR